jgi:hypothetical protein
MMRVPFGRNAATIVIIVLLRSASRQNHCSVHRGGRVIISETESTMKSLISAILLTAAIGVGTASAQTSTPAPAGQPATSHMSADQKSAISKSCSDQANAKGLHGKARRKFRSACKRAGGKAE